MLLVVFSPYQEWKPGWGCANAIRSHCKSSNAMIMLYFSGPLLISFHCDLAEKSTHCQMILYNYRIYGVLKQPLGKASKERAIHLFCSLCGSTQKEVVKMATVYYQTEEFKPCPGTICWAGGTHRTTHKWEVWYTVFLSVDGTLLRLSTEPGYPCSEDEELFLYPVSNSLLGRRCEWNADV